MPPPFWRAHTHTPTQRKKEGSGDDGGTRNQRKKQPGRRSPQGGKYPVFYSAASKAIRLALAFFSYMVCGAPFCLVALYLCQSAHTCFLRGESPLNEGEKKGRSVKDAWRQR